jgi:hypothetical protein
MPWIAFRRTQGIELSNGSLLPILSPWYGLALGSNMMMQLALSGLILCKKKINSSVNFHLG